VQKFDIFRETGDIRKMSDKEKRQIYISFANRRTKNVSFETDTSFLLSHPDCFILLRVKT